MAKPQSPSSDLAVRCAIYTRKSSEEGLEQDFNSLHAQREACEAYIKSQAGQGWRLLPTLYDDGGFSGGNIERPALQSLLADIDRGIVDIVVVYKIDRLTRSLMDFAKIVDRFDAKGASFVSVTQSFNTTTSMGRLTLNVLLSFAQFEREVTGERIRDKLAASKKKGLWMGGNLPLGYDASGRTLTINEAEAEQVRHIFARYLELKSAYVLRRELNAQGYRSKQRTTLAGDVIGGAAFSHGALYYLLSNPVYIGQIPHKNERYPGLHPPILDETTFEAVQQLLAQNTVCRRPVPARRTASPLTGRIFDQDGEPMSPTFCYGRNGVKYRYYVAMQAGSPKDADRIRRVSGPEIEDLVVEHVGRVLGLEGLADAELLARVMRVDIRPENLTCAVEVSGDAHSIAHAAGHRLRDGERVWLDGDRSLKIMLPLRAKRRAGRSWAMIDQSRTAASAPKPDKSLINALKRAHAILERTQFSPQQAAEGLGPSAPYDTYSRRLIRLAFLAPDLQRAILQGRQPRSLTLATLMADDVPLCWTQQRRILGLQNPGAALRVATPEPASWTSATNP